MNKSAGHKDTTRATSFQEDKYQTNVHAWSGWFVSYVVRNPDERFLQMSHVTRKPVFGVSDQVQHKPGCTTTEND